MATSYETAVTVISAIRSEEMSAVRLLKTLGMESRGAYIRKVMKALENAGILTSRKRSSTFSKAVLVWSLLIQEPTENMIKSALKSMSSSGREPRQPRERDGSGIAARLAALEALVRASGRGRLEIKVGDAKPVEMPAGEIVPAYFERMVQVAVRRKPIMLIGPAGCGKSHVGGMLAKSLGLKFRAISCTSGMSEVHLIGRSVPNIADGSSTFMSTDFLDCYENGGVFLLDEMDAADPNLLLVLNSALANGFISIPARADDAMAYQHRDFVIVASANTFGRGADRVYVGRNQLDESTIDRFRIGSIEVDYDRNVETALCPNERLLNALRQIRDAISKNGLRRVMSTRFIRDAAEMCASGWTIQQVVDCYFQGWNANERSRCLPVIPPEEEQSKGDGTEEQGDEAPSAGDDWKIPAMTLQQKAELGVEVTGLSDRQVEYAERLIAKWMRSGSAGLIAELREAQSASGVKFAGRVIRWSKMGYVPGSSPRASRQD